MDKTVELSRPDAILAGEACGNGPDVLLLHAGGETRAVWRPVMTRLAARGLRSVAFDQRGHGESGGLSAGGVGAYGDDAKAMIGDMHRPVVVGASLGGFALMLALEAVEEAVAGLVLVDVVPAPDRERTRRYLAPRGGLGASPLVEDILARGEEMARIVASLELPVLLVCGGARSPLDDRDRARFSALAPHSRIEVVAHASHLVARDAPVELSGLIAGFAQQADVQARRR